jgi:hypothetical protein
MYPLPDLERRQQAVTWVLTLTENTRLAPRPYEQLLLDRYAQGEIALDDIPPLFASRVHHILYRSRATHSFTDTELTELVAHSRPYNTYSDITGLLCYSDGYFVQFLEGPEMAVLELYAAIQQDPRHEQVETLSDAAGSARWFADWRMAVVSVSPPEFYWLLSHLEARKHTLIQPQIPIMDPYLLTLLEAFSTL